MMVGEPSFAQRLGQAMSRQRNRPLAPAKVVSFVESQQGSRRDPVSEMRHRKAHQAAVAGLVAVMEEPWRQRYLAAALKAEEAGDEYQPDPPPVWTELAEKVVQLTPTLSEAIVLLLQHGVECGGDEEHEAVLLALKRRIDQLVE